MVKAEEELEVVDNAGRTGSCPLIIRLKVPKTVTSDDLLPECVICGKRFQSEKAVHGHMRVHVIGQRECVEKESRELSPRRDVLPSTLSVGEKTSHECKVCRKSFPSRKSLHSHMRSHPDRTWRGVHPPAEGLFSGWSVTGKRGRQCSDSVSSGGLDLASMEIGSSTHKEADRVKDSLRFMAMNDKEYLKLSQSIPDEKVSVAGGSDENEKDAGVEIETKMPQDEKPPLDVPGIKAEEAESKNSRMSLSNDSPFPSTSRWAVTGRAATSPKGAPQPIKPHKHGRSCLDWTSRCCCRPLILPRATWAMRPEESDHMEQNLIEFL